MSKCPVKCSNVQMFSQMFWEKRKSIFKEGQKGHHHIVICSPGFNHFFLLKWKMSAFCMWSKIRDEAKGNLQKLQNQKPSPVSPLWNQLQNIAIIGEKCTSEEEIKLSIFKNVTNLHWVLCWCGLTNMGNIKRLPAACPVQQERQRSDIRNPQLLTKMSEAKRAFRSQGRPVECVEEEKVWIARKSWNRIKKLADWGLKSRQSMTHKYDTMWTRVMKAFPKTSSSRRSKSIIQIPCLIYISFFQDVPQNKLAKLRRHAGRVHFAKIQCGRSSISQRWGADLRPQCTLKIWIVVLKKY